MNTPLTSGELFAGYSGLALAVEHALGATTQWVSEIEDAPTRILTKHFPNTPNLGDITTIDWGTIPTVDIISGGSPCQDVSLAGARKGMTEGTRSNLWVAMREAITTIQPKLVVWENVKGAKSARATSNMEPCTGCLGETGHNTTTPPCGHSHVYSETLPAAGMTLNGYLYEHPTLGHRTAEKESSSSRTVVMPTPTATDGMRGGKNPYKPTNSALLLPDWINTIETGVPLTRKAIPHTP